MEYLQAKLELYIYSCQHIIKAGYYYNFMHICYKEFFMRAKSKLLTTLMTCLILGSINIIALADEAENLDTYHLPSITVEGAQDKVALPGGFQNAESRVGILGDTDVMKTPLTVHSISEKTVSAMLNPNNSVEDVLANVPGITIGTSPIKTDFSIRGIGANASLFSYNNVPGFFIMAHGPEAYTIGNVDVIVGPAATLNGSLQSYNGPQAGVPGTVYLYSKRPTTDNITRYTQTFSGHGNYGELFDVSRRFGKNNEWGLRVYGQFLEGGLPISDAGQRKKNIFLDLSHENDKSKTNLFAGRFDTYQHGTERRFNLKAKYLTDLPTAPNNKINFDYNGMYQHNYGWMTTLNHEQKMDENNSWFINAGANKMNLRRFIYGSQIDIDPTGNIENSTYPWSQYFLLENNYLQIGTNHKVESGALKHDFSFSVDRSYRKMHNNNNYWTFENGTPGNKYTPGLIGGSLYTGPIFNNAGMDKANRADELGKRFSFREVDSSINLVDNISINKFNIMLAGTRRHGNYLSKNWKGVPTSVKDNNIAPTYGIAYRPTENTCLYAARAESVTRGEVVGSTYANAGELLDSLKTTQTELGVKQKYKDLFFTLAYFEMNQPNNIEIENPTDAKSLLYKPNGENVYKGFDLNITGKLTNKWNTFGGIEYLDGKQEKTTKGQFDGKPVNGVANWRAIAGLEYKPDENSSIITRLNYSGTAKYVAYKDDNQFIRHVPSWKTVDVFASTKAKINGVPFTLKAQCYNLFNSSHWIAQTGQGTKFMLSNPRTLMLSAEFDF